MPVTHEEMVELAECVETHVVLIDRDDLPDALRGTPAGQVLTEIGLPFDLANVVFFRDKVDYVGSRHQGVDEPVEAAELIEIGMAGMNYVCVDRATGEVLTWEHRRGRRPLSASMPALVEIVAAILVELYQLYLSEPEVDTTLSVVWQRITDAIRRADPGLDPAGYVEWRLIFNDLCAELELPLETALGDVEVPLTWSDGTDELETTLHCADEAAADALRRRFGHLTAMLERLPAGSPERQAALDTVNEYGGRRSPIPWC